MKTKILLLSLVLSGFAITAQQRSLSDLINKSSVSGTEKIPVSGPSVGGAGTPGPSITPNMLRHHVVADSINDGLITTSPSQNAVFDALALKVPTTRTVNGHALSSNVTVTASDVGLGSVNNTSDANKPISTLQQGALDLKVNTTGSETIAGVKTFSSSPLVPTSTAGTSTTAAASTAFVQQELTPVLAIPQYILTPTSATTSTTLNTAVDIAGLSMSLSANSVYIVDGFIGNGCDNTGGVRFGFVTPTSTTYRVMAFGMTSGSTAFARAFYSTDGLVAFSFTTLNTSGNGSGVSFKGIVTTAANAGTFKLQFASGTSTQTSTIYKENSYIILTKIQ